MKNLRPLSIANFTNKLTQELIKIY